MYSAPSLFAAPCVGIRQSPKCGSSAKPAAPSAPDLPHGDTATATTTFDALAAARALEAAGIERRQAEAIAEGMREAATADRDELATKTDLATLEARMYRALWIQGGAIVAILGGFIAIAAEFK